MIANETGSLYATVYRRITRKVIETVEHSEPLQHRRETLMRLIDRKAVRAANKALLWDLPPVRLMCQAARKLEDAFAGNWSELVEED